uniref:Uncharacterized protein n=1 Tax=Sander lucioperca TaxID=283035 RepID=A0A8D0CQA2_SANLU
MWSSVLPLLVALSLLQLPDYTAATQDWQDYKYGRQDSAELHDKKHFCSWKCLLFTLQWPGAFCQSLDEETLCRIPPSINSWTIHDLTEHWPSLLQTQPSFHFWRDEWEKHGVCAACVEGMNSPLRYFQICLKLRGHFDIHKLLEDAGITPSCERLYKDRELWFQVKIPLSHNLTTGCDHHGDADWDVASGRSKGRRNISDRHPCPPQGAFYYVPIDHEQPRRPCG